MLTTLGWPPLAQRRREARLKLLRKIVDETVAIPKPII
jgi:hypothetical protein